MNRTFLNLVSCIGLSSLLLISCSKKLSIYESAVIAEREQKNADWKDPDRETPIPQDQKSSFEGLYYFDVDSTFRVTAVFKKLATPDSIIMATSTGVPRDGFKIADALFSIKGTQLSVPVYLLENRKGALDSSYYFIPFKDQTSGKESYPNGRYLDIHGPLTDGQMFVLDFNLAYNPLCNYSDNYSCPIPPKESFIDFAVTAGEKNYH